MFYNLVGIKFISKFKLHTINKFNTINKTKKIIKKINK